MKVAFDMGFRCRGATVILEFDVENEGEVNGVAALASRSVELHMNRLADVFGNAQNTEPQINRVRVVRAVNEASDTACVLTDHLEELLGSNTPAEEIRRTVQVYLDGYVKDQVKQLADINPSYSSARQLQQAFVDEIIRSFRHYETNLRSSSRITP